MFRIHLPICGLVWLFPGSRIYIVFLGVSWQGLGVDLPFRGEIQGVLLPGV